jgi:hypothetical protein
LGGGGGAGFAGAAVLWVVFFWSARAPLLTTPRMTANTTPTQKICSTLLFKFTATSIGNVVRDFI